MLPVLLACHPPLTDTDPDDEAFDLRPELTSPTIETAAWSCDVDKAQWTLEVWATSWTGGGRLYLTLDGEYVEQHRVRSVETAGNGSFDRLELTLSVASDWRTVTPSVSTAFGCASEPYALFVLLDDAAEQIDCRDLGPPGAPWTSVADFEACVPPEP